MDQVKEIDEQKLKTAFGDAFTSEVVAKCETDFESLDNCLELEYISPTTAVFNGADSPSSIERSIISFFFLLLCARICCVNHANFAGLNIKTFRIRKLFKRVRWDSDPRHFNPFLIDWLRARRSTWLSYEPSGGTSSYADI